MELAWLLPSPERKCRHLVTIDISELMPPALVHAPGTSLCLLEIGQKQIPGLVHQGRSSGKTSPSERLAASRLGHLKVPKIPASREEPGGQGQRALAVWASEPRFPAVC